MGISLKYIGIDLIVFHLGQWFTGNVIRQFETRMFFGNQLYFGNLQSFTHKPLLESIQLQELFSK